MLSALGWCFFCLGAYWLLSCLFQVSGVLEWPKQGRRMEDWVREYTPQASEDMANSEDVMCLESRKDLGAY